MGAAIYGVYVDKNYPSPGRVGTCFCGLPNGTNRYLDSSLLSFFE